MTFIIFQKPVLEYMTLYTRFPLKRVSHVLCAINMPIVKTQVKLGISYTHWQPESWTGFICKQN